MKLPKEVRNFLRENKRNILILGVITFTTLFVLETYKYFFTNYEGFLNEDVCYEDVYNYAPQVTKTRTVYKDRSKRMSSRRWFGCGCRKRFWGTCKGCYKTVYWTKRWKEPRTETYLDPATPQRIQPFRREKSGNFNIRVNGYNRSVNAAQCLAYARGNPLDECIKFCNSGSNSTSCSQKCSGLHPST